MIEFLKQYWGHTIIGSLTVGALVLGIIASLKSIIKAKLGSVQANSIKQSVTDFNDKCQETVNKLLENNNKLQHQLKYEHYVQTVLFKAISYLITASKLPTEEKLALQREFVSLSEYANKIDDALETAKPLEEIIEDLDITTVIDETSKRAKTLLDKYTR